MDIFGSILHTHTCRHGFALPSAIGAKQSQSFNELEGGSSEGKGRGGKRNSSLDTFKKENNKKKT